jgi:hypothetical protein
LAVMLAASAAHSESAAPIKLACTGIYTFDNNPNRTKQGSAEVTIDFASGNLTLSHELGAWTTPLTSKPTDDEILAVKAGKFMAGSVNRITGQAFFTIDSTVFGAEIAFRASCKPGQKLF